MALLKVRQPDDTWVEIVPGGASPDQASMLAAHDAAIDANTAAIARVDPGVAAPGNGYMHGYQGGILGWKKRTTMVVVDDHASVAAALTALGSVTGRRELVFLGDGPYTVPNAGIVMPNHAATGVKITSMGSRAAVLQAPGTASGTAVITLWPWSGHTIVEGIEVDCNANATMVNGIVSSGNEAQFRDLRLTHVIIRKALGYGFNSWKSNGVTLEGVEAYDCGFGLYVDEAVGQVRIIRPRVVNGVSGRMQYGIRVTNGNNATDTDVEIVSPHVAGADYATASGAEAHGISIANSNNWKIMGGYVTDCGNPANDLGGGLVVGLSHNGGISDFSAVGNHATGIWFELNNPDTTLGTAGQVRGVHASNISVIGNGAAGMSTSYGAGSEIHGLTAAMNGVEGFVNDADRVILTNFAVFNNWQNGSAPAPAQNDGSKAGIRVYNGVRNIIVNGHCYDNQASKTQAYGVAVEETGHILSNIVTLDADHVTDGLIESTGAGPTNVKTNVVTT